MLLLFIHLCLSVCACKSLCMRACMCVHESVRVCVCVCACVVFFWSQSWIILHNPCMKSAPISSLQRTSFLLAVCVCVTVWVWLCVFMCVSSLITKCYMSDKRNNILITAKIIFRFTSVEQTDGYLIINVWDWTEETTVVKMTRVSIYNLLNLENSSADL